MAKKGVKCDWKFEVAVPGGCGNEKRVWNWSVVQVYQKETSMDTALMITPIVEEGIGFREGKVFTALILHLFYL